MRENIRHYYRGCMYGLVMVAFTAWWAPASAADTRPSSTPEQEERAKLAEPSDVPQMPQMIALPPKGVDPEVLAPPPPPARPSVPALPTLVVVLVGTEQRYVASDGGTYTFYKLAVTNHSAYRESMFALASTLPPCGQRASASRTWVYIKNQVGYAIKTFCGFLSNASLEKLEFGVPIPSQLGIPPTQVQVVLWDRQVNKQYVSNWVVIPH